MTRKGRAEVLEIDDNNPTSGRHPPPLCSMRQAVGKRVERGRFNDNKNTLRGD